MSYCEYVKGLPKGNVHVVYHDKHYGKVIKKDDELFCRLVLEINQAGLSWDTILKKEVSFRKAYSNFDLKKVAKYGTKDTTRLMHDAGIIRNRLKISAAIHNAQIILEIIKEHKSFYAYIKQCNFQTAAEAVKVFKKRGFRFVGGEIMNEFLMSIGELKSPHHPTCKHYKK